MVFPISTSVVSFGFGELLDKNLRTKCPKARAPLCQATCGPKDVCSQKGILLPLFIEVTWPWWLRVLLYFSGLIYSFVAVNIIADIFMCSIESISSKTKGRHQHKLRKTSLLPNSVYAIGKGKVLGPVSDLPSPFSDLP